MPARLRWSSIATPICSSGCPPSRRSASSRSQSGPRTSGPRWPTSRSSSAVGHHVDVVQPVADALPVVGGQDQADVVGRSAVPFGRAGRCASCRPCGSACATCGRRPAGSAGACRGVRPRGPSRPSGRGWPAAGCRNSPRRSVAPGQRGVHPLRGQPDSVSFGHAPSVPRRPANGVSPLTTGMTRVPALEPSVSVPLRLRARFGAEADRPPRRAGHRDRGPRGAPDQREAFERWAEDVLRGGGRASPATSARPAAPGPDSSEYHLVYRFEDDESLAAWERSSERRSALAQVE